MEKRRRRRRHSESSSSNLQKPLSINLPGKKRRGSSKKKRIASVRLDLDSSESYSSNHSSKTQIFSKIVALIVVIGAIIAICSDYGWGKLSSNISSFVGSISRGAQNSVADLSADEEETTLSKAFTDIEKIQQEQIENKPNIKRSFEPQGNNESLSKIQLALSASAVGLVEPALELLEQAQIADSELTGIPILKAQIYLDNDLIKEAREQLLIARENKSSHYFATVNLGELEYNQQNYRKAIPYLAETRKLDPQRPHLASLYSFCLRMNGQYQEGLFEAQAAQRLGPESKIMEISTTLAAIQAGSYELTEEIKPLVDGSPLDTTVSPFLLIVAAGWEQMQGNTEKVTLIWNSIRSHSSKMKSLQVLEEDPLFRRNFKTSAKDQVQTLVHSSELNEALDIPEQIPNPNNVPNLILETPVSPPTDFMELNSQPETSL